MLQAPPPAKDKKKQQENQQNKPNKDDDRNLPAKQLDYHMNKYDNDNLKGNFFNIQPYTKNPSSRNTSISTPNNKKS